MKKVALFGGSFDPPHIAHEQIVKKLVKLDFIDKVVVMPTYLNPFKKSFYADAKTRLRWLRMMFDGCKDVEVSDFEVRQNRAVASIESVEYLLRENDKVYLVIGADNLKSLESWNNFLTLKNMVEFIVVSRDNIKVPDDFLSLHVDIDVSSTSLRQNINKDMLPKVCANEIYRKYNAKEN